MSRVFDGESVAVYQLAHQLNPITCLVANTEYISA
jgi:hypothetical protein